MLTETQLTEIRNKANNGFRPESPEIVEIVEELLSFRRSEPVKRNAILGLLSHVEATATVSETNNEPLSE